MVREGLLRWLPSALGAVVQGYCEASEEEVWDEDAGVPLGDVWGEVVDLGTEISRLQEENARLRERAERDSREIASLQEENARLREVGRQEEGRGGLKRARDGHQDQEGDPSDAKRGRGPGGLP